MSKNLTQLTEKTTLSDNDIFHIVRSNIDYKVKYANLISSAVGLISVTYAQAQALITALALVPGRFYILSDKADAGIIVQAISTSAFSIEATGFYFVPDFQDVGLQTGNINGVWHSGLSGLTPNISIAFYDGLHYKNLTGNVGTAPSGDAVNWVAMAKTLANGYILEGMSLQYNFTGDTINLRVDKRGNIVANDGNNYAYFQFGNDFCSNNKVIHAASILNNINQRGLFVDNIFNNCNVIFTNASTGTIRENKYNSGYANLLTCSATATIAQCTFNYIGVATAVAPTVNITGVTVDFDIRYVAPATGATITCAAYERKIVLNPAGTIAALTIALSATSLYDGKVLDITTTADVTAITVNGGTVVGMPAGLAIGHHRLTYVQANTSWYY